MKVIFMGTPEFAVPTLQVLFEENCDVVGVITQPDKPKGRGNKMNMPPVKEEALKNNIPVYQPTKVKDDEFVKVIKSLNPDLIVVVAFGQILSKDILDIPKYGCINVHASLLPKYRGAAPINWVIINGEKSTGITTMFMDTGLDTGDMILKREIEIKDEDTAGTLHDKLASIGKEVLRDTLKLIKEDKLVREKQDDSVSSYAAIMDKNLGAIDWNKSATDIYNIVKGTNPWPGAFTKYKDLTMKIWQCKPINDISSFQPGHIIDVSKEGILVATKDKSLLITEIQMPGKKRMLVSEYIKGNEIEKSIFLGA